MDMSIIFRFINICRNAKTRFIFSAVRFGRMPKAEREKLVADKEELSSLCSSRIMELRTLSDNLKGAFVDCFSSCSYVNYFLNKQSKGAQVQVKVRYCDPLFFPYSFF